MRPNTFKTLLLLNLAAPLLALAQAGGTLDKVKQSGTITLAYRESSIPFSYLDDKAQPVGFAHEICL
jgi:ABC-type amino acid transport substrate-binding protein